MARRESDLQANLAEHVTCTICLDVFETPRTLPCLHVFCDGCLRQLLKSKSSKSFSGARSRMLTCPNCTVSTKIPDSGVDGFPHAFYQSGLIDLYWQVRTCPVAEPVLEDDLWCMKCNENGTENEATAVCGECIELLCSICVECHAHVKPKHITVQCACMTREQLLTFIQKQHKRRETLPICGLPTSQKMAKRENQLSSSAENYPDKFRMLRQINLNFDPSGICCYTKLGLIVVCEWNGDTVRILTRDGRTVADLDTPQSSKVFDVECDDKRIYVADRSTNSVLCYEGVSEPENYPIHDILFIAGLSNVDDMMYIVDRDSNVVHRRKEHMFIKCKPLNTEKEVDEPTYVCSRGKRVAVSSTANHCVHVMDPAGKLIYTHGVAGQVGDDCRHLNNPMGVALDSSNTLLIADYHNHRVCLVSSEGLYMDHIDLPKHGVRYPRALAIDNEGHLLVACYKPHCIVKFDYRAKGGCVIM